MRDDTRSLWEQYDSEIEPWRRGRMILVLIGLFSLVLQALNIMSQIALANVELLLPTISTFVVFWLLFYLIWIGINWIRWLAAAWCGVVGFIHLIRGWVDGNSFLVVFGCIDLTVGVYLGASSSVYFFAKRQREKRNWIRVVSVAMVLALVFAGAFVASVGLSAYKFSLEEEADQFAGEAFERIFKNHDTEFLLDRITARGLIASGGREQLMRFVKTTALQTGDLRDINRTGAWLKLTYGFPVNFGCTSRVTAQGTGAAGPVQLQLEITNSNQDWQIETLSWQYLDYSHSSRRR
jgi:hypothetical protein